jgi:broad specificity phosphatase PhoE
MTLQEIYLIRHGETEWSLSGQYTGVRDVQLTERGRQAARSLKPELVRKRFDLVMTSPMQRARATCELAGLGGRAQIESDLLEWDYGAYEGLTLDEIRAGDPGWVIFRDGCPNGETPEHVAHRVDRVIAKVRARRGAAALFSHGHVLRMLAARWLGLAPEAGSHFLLDLASVSILSSYRGIPAVRSWNTRITRAATGRVRPPLQWKAKVPIEEDV